MTWAGDRRGDGRVEELQGLYGPYAFPEKLLQKIWWLGLFDRRGARLVDGRSVEVLSPGRWNLLGGPDFRGAHLRIGGAEAWGDVEVHFDSADWWHHGHDRDPAYAEVVLHVVLFEPKVGRPPPRTSAGREIPQLVLLPYLSCSLEEFAADDAVEALAQRDALRLADTLLAIPPETRLGRLREAALKRWRQKVHFSGVRLKRLGWTGACHHSALEVLGYRHNRAAMLAVAERYPLPAWVGGVPEPDALAAADGLWRAQGVRPANAPRRRLGQYRAWVAAVPDWPERWLEFCARSAAGVREASSGPDGGGRRGAAARRRWLEHLRTVVTGNALQSGRFVTLVNNALLPLAAAHSGADLFGVWYAGAPGEAPDLVRKVLRLAGVVGRGAGRWHEGAVQGMLQVLYEQAGGEWGRGGEKGGLAEG